jgi:hypothetical protein
MNDCCPLCSRWNGDGNSIPRVGETRYVAYSDEVQKVRVVKIGSDRHYKAPILNPITVRACDADCSDRWCERDHEYTIGASQLYCDPLACAIRSAEMGGH